jgi:simple sugar transport system substrate-binding protein
MKQKDDQLNESGAGAISRRDLLTLSALAGGGLLLGGAQSASAAPTRTGVNGPAQGPKKKMIGALAYASCPCVGVIQVGFHNAAELAGWDYQGILTAPSVTDSAETLNQTYQQAIASKPAAIGGGMWFPTAAQQATRAIAQGIYFQAVNTPDNAFIARTRTPYVGQDLFLGGELCARQICDQLVKNGKKTGVILTGNVSPGSVPIDTRYAGIQAGTVAYNKANKTNFSNQQFPDMSTDLAQSIPLYHANFKQLGSNLVGLANTSTQTAIANYKLAQQLKWKPGQYVMGGFDTAPTINEAIKNGYLLFTLDQQFFVQGFITLMQAWQKLERNFTPPAVYDTGNAVVTKANIGAINARDNAVIELAKRYGLKVG